MHLKDIVAVTRYLVDADKLPESLLEVGEEDNNLTDKLNIELVFDSTDTYAVVKYEDKEIIVLSEDQGLKDYVRDRLLGMEEDQVLEILEAVSDDFEEVMELWYGDFEEYGEHLVSDNKLASRIKQGLKRVIAKGIGNYRRGEVLTDITAVDPGQLLILDSVVYNETNLIKVTQTFDDKFYAIFVNPENPTEKRQASDEEFVVYANDLERGEYNIALEPAPTQPRPDTDDSKDIAPGADPDAKQPNGEEPELEPDVDIDVDVVEDSKEKEVPKQSIKNPVRKHLDYGEKVAYGEEPASVVEVPTDNPVATDDTGNYEMKSIDITSYNRYASDEYSDIDDFYEYEDEDEDEEDLESEYTLKYVDGEVEEVDSYEAVVITEANFGGYSAFYEGKEIAKATELDELADEIQFYLSQDKDYTPNIIHVGERGDMSFMSLTKKSGFDIFAEDVVEDEDDYTDNLGAHASFAHRVLDSLASAPGGLGDDGSAYDLTKSREFAGVDEEEAEVVAEQYLEGGAVGFADVDDFVGFVGDSYGIKAAKDSDLYKNFKRAWHNRDKKSLSTLIVGNAVKNDLIA